MEVPTLKYNRKLVEKVKVNNKTLPIVCKCCISNKWYVSAHLITIISLVLTHW